MRVEVTVKNVEAAPTAVREWSTANGYRLTGARWEVDGDPGPSTGSFDVGVSLLVEGSV